MSQQKLDDSKFILEFQSGERSGERFPIPGSGLRLGRSKECDVQIEDRSISRVHCSLHVAAHHVKVVDENSRWGTFVNGAQIQSHSLRVGDQLRIGECELRFLKAGAPSTGWDHHEDETVFRSFQVPSTADSIHKPDSLPAQDARQFLLGLVGKPFSDFVVGKKLEVTNTGVVFAAWDERQSRKVALKLFWPTAFANGTHLKKFISAIEIASDIKHANVVRVYRAGCTQGICFTASELVDGMNAVDLVQDRGVGGMLEWRQVLTIAIAAADGLAAMADSGLLHGSINPTNLVIPKEDLSSVKLNDFYHCTRTDQPSQNALTPNNTESIHFEPPERATGQIPNQRSDVYSLGATVYWMLTGHAPIADATPDQRPPAPSKYQLSVSPLLEGEVMRALERRPEDRHRTAEELADAFRKITKYSDFV